MSKSIFDFLPSPNAGDASLDESPPKFKDIRHFVDAYRKEGSDILSITLTTTTKTKFKKKFLNKILPINHLKAYRTILHELFGNTSYMFYIDYQKRGQRLVHVHGILINEFPQYHEMLCNTITRMAEKKLSATIHDVRSCHTIQGWSDYCSKKIYFPPIINVRDEKNAL